jgi:transposase
VRWTPSQEEVVRAPDAGYKVSTSRKEGANVSQSNTDQGQRAETRTQETRTFIRQVRAASRKKYSPEEKIRIVLEGFRREVAVSDLCRREGIRPGTFYAWTKEFMEAGKDRLTRDTTRDATRQEIVSLKRENHDLKELVADLSLEVYRFKKTALPALENTHV